jgi:hypothetical protein
MALPHWLGRFNLLVTNRVRNVLAAGGCRLCTRGRWVELTAPRRFRDPARRSVPWPVRPVLWLIGADWFLELRRRRAPGG